MEEFREMLMRVGRLPSAPIGAVAMDEAFATAIPEAARVGTGAMSARGFDMASPPVTNVRDLLSDLEREIFRDEPAQDHPTAMPPALGSTIPEIEAAAAAVEPPAAAAIEPTPPTSPPRELGDDLHEVPVDSRWTPAPGPQADLFDVARINALPPPPTRQPEPELAMLPLVDAAATTDDDAGVEHLAWAGSPALDPTATEAAPPNTPRRSDTVMRVAVGLGAAACVLLAAFLYEGGFLSGNRKTAATVPRATATARVQPTASVAPSPSASPTAPPAPVLFRLGNGVTGGTLYRIRPGTAVAGYTRLVFDIRGRGLPAMVITRPDTMHIAIMFANTAGAAVPVKGIHSFQVAGVEPAVQQGPDLVITVDLARPDRVTAFTLPAAGAYSPRLVVDLHTS
ncbi:MAG: hypothetical protein ABI289_01365 [Candidatus Dormibacter sp.]